MKAKRRHELQHNVLDAELGKTIDFLKVHGPKVLWGAIIVLAVVMGIYWLIASRSRKVDQIEGQYATLRSAVLAGPSVGSVVKDATVRRELVRYPDSYR